MEIRISNKKVFFKAEMYHVIFTVLYLPFFLQFVYVNFVNSLIPSWNGEGVGADKSECEERR